MEVIITFDQLLPKPNLSNVTSFSECTTELLHMLQVKKSTELIKHEWLKEKLNEPITTSAIENNRFLIALKSHLYRLREVTYVTWVKLHLKLTCLLLLLRNLNLYNRTIILKISKRCKRSTDEISKKTYHETLTTTVNYDLK